MITSLRNKRVAMAARLKKRALREKDRAFLVEGAQGVKEALASGTVRQVFLTGEADERHRQIQDAAARAGTPSTVVSPDVMAHLTSTVTPQGVVAVAEFVDVPLDAIAPDAGLVPVLVEVRDPGNAGTILRSADAAAAGGVVFTASSVDLYNPKTVRASAGSLFHVPVVRGAEPEGVAAALRRRGWRVLAATARGEVSVYDADLTRPTAVLFGNEARGLSPGAEALAHATVRVPIAGRAESLNLAAAATLVIFEWARQREAETGAFPTASGGRLADMVAGAAHDVRSPITAMKAFASTLRSRWDRLNDEERRLMLDGVTHEGLRMEAVIAQLVDAARIESGTLHLSTVPVDLLGATRAVVAELGERDAIDVEVSGDPVDVDVDLARLRTMLGAMLEGIRWWAEEGPVRVEVRRDPVPTVRVARAGPSISFDSDRIFVPRAPGTGSGSKIGLFVARRLAEAHGGSLRAEAGAELVLTLQLRRRG